MTTELSFVEHIRSQSGLGAELTCQKMFGEYAIYLHGKVIAFACDNQLYLKPTDAGRSALGKVSEHPPFPGAKSYFRVDEETDDRELLRKVFEVTARALPLPRPKAPAKARAAARKAPGRTPR